MKITSVERSKKNTDRLLVYIDGSYAFSIAEEEYLRLSLYEERDITQEEIDQIKNGMNYRTAKSSAIKYLSLKLRSAREVYIKLSSDGYDEETVENVIAELQAMGYINDRIYVQKFLYDRSKLKPKSKKLLKLELQQKGISNEIIDEVVDDWEIDEYSVAEGLAKKKFGKYDFRDENTVKKIFSFLHHRGFNYSLIEEVVNKLKQECR